MSDSMDKLAKGIRNAIDEKNDRKPKAYDTQAEVLSKDGDILWVHIPGGVDRTPVRRTVDANEGDSVMVRVADGRAWTLGNATNPPTDDSYARRGLRDLRNATHGAVEYVSELSDKNITVNSIYAATGYIDDLYSKNIHTENIWAATGYIDDLTSKHITAEDIEADHITVGTIEGTYAKITDLTAANAKIDNLEANEAVINDTLKATNAEVEYLSSDWISTDRLVLTGNNKNNYPPVQITEVEFNVNKTAYWTKDGNNFVQCTEQSVYDEDTQYYVRQSVKAIIEAINNANRYTAASPTQAEFNADKTSYYTYDGAEYIQCKSTDTYNPSTQYYIYDTEILVSKDKLIAASIDVAELSAITADMGTLTAGKIQKGNNFINLNTVPASMEFKNGSTWANSTQGLQFDTQGNLNIKGTINVVGSGSNVPTTQEVTDAIDDINIGGRNLLKKSEVSLSTLSGNTNGGTTTKVISEGSQITVSVMVDADNVTWDTTTSYQRIGCEMSMPKSGGGYQYVGVWAGKEIWDSANIVAEFTGSFHGRVSKTFTLLGDISIDKACYLYIQGVNSGSVTVSNIKLEVGNKATDWTQAPEDVKSVHTIRATGTDASYTYAQLLDYSSRTTNLQWSVESTIGVKAGDTVRVGIAVSNMGTADNRPLAYVLVEVSSVDAANNRIYGYSKGLDTTIIDGGNIITNSIGANQINTNSIDIGSFGGSIGGHNLVTHSLNLSDFLEESRANCKITVYPESASITHVANSTSRLGIFYDILSPEVGAKYTLSFVASTATGDYSVGGSGTSSVWAGIVTYTAIKAGKNTVTFTVPSNATSLRIYFSVNSYNATATVSNVQLEKGSVATDWKPSPYDIEPKQRIKADKIKLESSTYVSYSVSGDSITMNRISTSGGNYGMFYDLPCEPNSYYTVSAKVTARTGTSWGIYFGYRDSEYAQGSVWTGLGRIDNSAGVGGYYISRNSTATASTQTHIRLYFCSTVSGDSWTIEDITFQKGGDLATSSSYITHIDNSGITIHPTSTTNDRIALNAGGMAVYKGNNLKANFSDSIHLYGGNGTSPHLYLNSSMLQLVKDSNNYTQVDANGMQVHQGGIEVAKFGSSAQVGPTGKGRVEITPSGIDMYGYNDSAGVKQLAHIGYASGAAASGQSVAPYYTFGTRSGNIGNYSIVEGASCTASAIGSHASGGSTQATGNYSHASGLSTIASGNYQTVIGHHNISDTSSLFIIGNGTSSSRSNAFRIDSVGNLYMNNGQSLYLNNGAGSSFDWTRIYAGTSSGTSNMYLQADGYLAFYVGDTSHGPSGRTYIEYDQASFYQKIYAAQGVNVANNNAVRGLNTSGTPKALIFISNSNTVNVGNSDCATYVNGTSFSGSKSYTGSDLRLKHDIILLDDRSSELIMSLKPFEYKWNEGQEHFYSKGKCFGLGAQEVSKLMNDIGYDPEDYRVVEETPDGYLAICYTELIPHLIYVAQKQQKEIEELKGIIKCIS